MSVGSIAPGLVLSRPAAALSRLLVSCGGLASSRGYDVWRWLACARWLGPMWPCLWLTRVAWLGGGSLLAPDGWRWARSLLFSHHCDRDSCSRLVGGAHSHRLGVDALICCPLAPRSCVGIRPGLSSSSSGARHSLCCGIPDAAHPPYSYVRARTRPSVLLALTPKGGSQSPSEPRGVSPRTLTCRLSGVFLALARRTCLASHLLYSLRAFRTDTIP